MPELHQADYEIARPPLVGLLNDKAPDLKEHDQGCVSFAAPISPHYAGYPPYGFILVNRSISVQRKILHFGTYRSTHLPFYLLYHHTVRYASFATINLKKTCRLASPAFGRRQRRNYTYTVFLKFLATSNWLPARNLSFLTVHRKIAILKLTAQKVCHLDQFPHIFLIYVLEIAAYRTPPEENGKQYLAANNMPFYRSSNLLCTLYTAGPELYPLWE
jgi:hypothetical protein